MLDGPHRTRASPPTRSVPAVVTVGTFDGIHRGHRELLDRLQRKASELGAPSVLVTFDPHPLEIVRPEAAPRLLTPPAEKIEILAQTGLDHVVFLRFDRHLASYEPRRFVQEILLERLGVAHLVIGYDHGFGRNRSGDAATLIHLGREIGFGVDIVGPVMLDGQPVSSTLVRAALERGDVRGAAAALGRPYTLSGKVVHGAGRGQALGFPTANIGIPDPRKLVPLDGIYAVHAELSNHRVQGLLHIGPRPTFGDAGSTIELYLIGFDGDLYGERLRVALCERLRGVERFASAADLVQKMESDRAAAELVFARGSGACG